MHAACIHGAIFEACLSVALFSEGEKGRSSAGIDTMFVAEEPGIGIQSAHRASSHSWSRAPMAPRCETIRTHSLSGWQLWWFGKHVPMDNTKTRFNIFLETNLSGECAVHERTRIHLHALTKHMWMRLSQSANCWRANVWCERCRLDTHLGDKCVDAMHACLSNIHILRFGNTYYVRIKSGLFKSGILT
jgi:hypothetical protein